MVESRAGIQDVRSKGHFLNYLKHSLVVITGRGQGYIIASPINDVCGIITL